MSQSSKSAIRDQLLAMAAMYDEESEPLFGVGSRKKVAPKDTLSSPMASENGKDTPGPSSTLASRGRTSQAIPTEESSKKASQRKDVSSSKSGSRRSRRPWQDDSEDDEDFVLATNAEVDANGVSDTPRASKPEPAQSSVSSTRSRRTRRVVKYEEDSDDETTRIEAKKATVKKARKSQKKQETSPQADFDFDSVVIRGLPNFSKMSHEEINNLQLFKTPEKGESEETNAERRKSIARQKLHTAERDRIEAGLRKQFTPSTTDKPRTSAKQVSDETQKRSQHRPPVPMVFKDSPQATMELPVKRFSASQMPNQGATIRRPILDSRSMDRVIGSAGNRPGSAYHPRFLSLENSSNKRTPPPTPDVALITMKGNAGKGHTSSSSNSVNGSSSGYRGPQVQSAKTDGSAKSNNCRRSVKPAGPAPSSTTSSSSDSPTSPAQIHPNQHTQGVVRCYKKYMVPIIEGNEPLSEQLFASLATKVDNMYNAGKWTKAEDVAPEPTVKFNGNRNYGGCEKTISRWFPEFQKPYENHQRLLKNMEQQKVSRKRQFAGQGSSGVAVTSANLSIAQPRKSVRVTKPANYVESDDETEHASNCKRSKRSTKESDDESYNDKLQ